MRSRTLLLLVALVLCPTASRGLDFTPPECPVASPFSDVSYDAPACPWVRQATQDGFLPGCGGGKFCPDQPVTRGQTASYLERAMRGTSSWSPGQGHYARTIVVNPLPGNPQASGVALLAAIAATVPANAANRYLIKLEPGIYDVSGSAGVQVRPYVDLEGSGVGVTTIVAQSLTDTGLLDMDGESGLRLLTVRGETSQGNPTSISVYNPGVHRLSHVRVESLHGIALGCQSDASLRIDHSRLQTQASAALLLNGCDATVEDTDLKVTNSGFARGISIGGGASLRLRRSEVHAGGGTNANFALSSDDATVFLEGVHLRASDGLSGNPFVAAASLVRSNATIVASDLEAVSSSANRWTLHADSDAGAFVIRVRDSRFRNGAIQASASDDILISESQLDAAAVDPNGGGITCHKSFDGNFANPGGLSACP